MKFLKSEFKKQLVCTGSSITPILNILFFPIEKQYVTAKEYAKLTEKEQVTLVSRFLSENLLEPLQLIWKAHTHITAHQDGKKCAESILCHLNAHMRDQGMFTFRFDENNF